MEQKHRSEFPENELWDLTAPLPRPRGLPPAIEKAREDIKNSSVITKGKLQHFRRF